MKLAVSFMASLVCCLALVTVDSARSLALAQADPTDELSNEEIIQLYNASIRVDIGDSASLADQPHRIRIEVKNSEPRAVSVHFQVAHPDSLALSGSALLGLFTEKGFIAFAPILVASHGGRFSGSFTVDRDIGRSSWIELAVRDPDAELSRIYFVRLRPFLRTE